MSRLIVLITLLLMSSGLFSQVPQAFSYQAIVLDGSANPVTEQSVGVEVQILDGAINGPVIYTETHTVDTNMNGVYTMAIGQGTPVNGNFTEIDWADGSKFLSISQDITGGSNYEFIGASQLLSVPYALYAGQAEVAPKIYAYRVTGRDDNVLINSQASTALSFFIIYEWIQGEPEDVFVEFNNLPANTNLSVKFEAGHSFFEPFDNLSAVDTIFDGLRVRNLDLVRTDPTVDLIPGDYVIEIVYRTASTVLTTIDYPISIFENDPDDPDPNPDCLNSEPSSTHVLISNDCTELEDLLLDEIEIIVTEFDPNEIKVQLFNTDANDIPITVEQSPNGECFYQGGEFYFIADDGAQYEGRIESVDVTEEELVLNVFVDIFPNDQDPEPMPVDCTLRYTR